MAEINYADDYRAEKHLRELSKTDKKKLRADRKRKQKERLAIMSKLDELENERCEKCIERSANTVQCDCPAAQAIRTLGQRLLKLSDGEGDGILRKDKEIWASLTVDEYEAMKEKGMSDKEVMKKIRWATARFYEWKKDMGLTERPSTVPARVNYEGKPLNGMTVADYRTYKSEKLSDAMIIEKIGVAPHTFQQWKRDNDLTRAHKVGGRSKGEKMINDTLVVDKAIHERLEKDFDTMKNERDKYKEQFNSAAKEYSELKTESLGYRKRIEELEAGVKGLEKSVMDAGDIIKRKNEEIVRQANEVSELKRSLATSTQTFTATDAQEEIWKLSQEVERLKKYEHDYRNLEVDFRNLHTENERMKRMLDRLKHTERMNLWMMEQYVGLHKQVDEVLA